VIVEAESHGHVSKKQVLVCAIGYVEAFCLELWMSFWSTVVEKEAT